VPTAEQMERSDRVVERARALRALRERERWSGGSGAAVPSSYSGR